MRKVAKKSIIVFSFCSKINTTYQGLLRATSIFVIVLKLMWLVLVFTCTHKVILILLQNLKTVIDYFETFVMTVLLKSKQKLPNAYFQTR